MIQQKEISKPSENEFKKGDTDVGSPQNVKRSSYGEKKLQKDGSQPPGADGAGKVPVLTSYLQMRTHRNSTEIMHSTSSANSMHLPTPRYDEQNDEGGAFTTD